VFMRKDAVLEPLYQFDHSTDESRVADMMENDRLRKERKNEVGTGSGSDIQVENSEGMEKRL